MTRRRGPAVAAGLAALVTLLVVVAGLPVLLYKLGGSPLPGHLPGLPQVGRDLLHRDSSSVVLAAVRDVSWIAWAAFTLAVLAELQAILRSRTPPRLRLGGMQHAAGQLVALAALTFTSAPVGTLLAMSPPASAATVSVVPRADVTALPRVDIPAPPPLDLAASAPAPAQAPPAPARAEMTAAASHADLADVAQQDAIGAQSGTQGMSMGFFQLVTVRPGDCLWTIAQQYLGNGDRFQEIVALNLGHDMGHGQVFSDPSVVWPGWVLHLPAAAAGGGTPGPVRPHTGKHAGPPAQTASPAPASPAPASPPGATQPAGAHDGHPTSHPHYRHPHQAASSAPSAPASAGTIGGGSASEPVPTASRPGVPAQAASPAQSAGSAQQASSDTTTLASAQDTRLPLFAAFGTGVLAGGAAVGLARLRHRQRQIRRRGRRIPLPASAPVAEAEQRLHLASARQPVAGLRGVLHYLGAGLLATGQQIPDITALRLQPEFLEVLVASPAVEPPPAPFTVPGGRQGKAWRLRLDDALEEPSAQVGDLLPGLLTIGTADGGYLLVDLEHLQVTTVNGPAAMTEAVLRSAAIELATGQLAGWFDLILVGFPELAVLGGRGTCCDGLDAGLDLLAAKAVALRRRLGDAPAAEVRYHRLADPADEDWALTLLVSAEPPTPGQLALLSDLASDPGGIAALVPGGVRLPDGHRAPAALDLVAAPADSGTVLARVRPLQLEAHSQSLDDADYEALTSLFATAVEGYDVGPADPPYDNWIWPPDVISRDNEVADEADGAALATDPDLGQSPAGGAGGTRLAQETGVAEETGVAQEAGMAEEAGVAGEVGLAREGRRSEAGWSEAGWAEAAWARDSGLAETAWADDPAQAEDAGLADDAGWIGATDWAAEPARPGGAHRAAEPGWAADPSRGEGWLGSVDRDRGDALDHLTEPAWTTDPAWPADPADSAWPADPADSAWPSDPADSAWLSDPADSGWSADRAEPGWTADSVDSGLGADRAEPGWPADPADSGLGADAAESGRAGQPDSAWPADPVASDAGWGDDGDDPAVTGLPGQPATWLHDPAGPKPPARPASAVHLASASGPAGSDAPESAVGGRPEPSAGRPKPATAAEREPATPGAPESAAVAHPAAPGTASPKPAEADQQALRIGVLGTFTINGQPGALLPAQSQLVLALALNGTSGLSNQQLCYLLGADPDRPKPSDSLRQLIVRTRRQLGRAPDGREWIQHLGGGQYALHQAARFDWHEFDALVTEGMRSRDADRLREALGLIRGRPFTGCYYWWLDLAMTETVRAQIVDAADVLAALELASGHAAAAARAARIGLAGDAGAEQLWRALMRAEHAAGNLSGVREAWNRCLDAISEIAPDGEPHPGTAALYRELLGGASARPAWAGG